MKVTMNIILLLFMVSACAGGQGFTTIKYEKESVIEPSKEEMYSMKVPKGYKLKKLVGGHKEIEKQYIYPDSSIVYIGDFRSGMLNYNNILSLGDSIANARFESIELKAKALHSIGKEFTPDTVTLQGQTKEGLYWKDIRIGYLSIGYTNVPKERKDEFEQALSSFSKK